MIAIDKGKYISQLFSDKSIYEAVINRYFKVTKNPKVFYMYVKENKSIPNRLPSFNYLDDVAYKVYDHKMKLIDDDILPIETIFNKEFWSEYTFKEVKEDKIAKILLRNLK